MKWTRKNKVLLVVATVVLVPVPFVVEFCRVQISLSRIVDRVTLGATVDATEARVGKATYHGSWSQYGPERESSGVTLVYQRPYVWEYVLDHVLASLPTDISFSPFYIEFSGAWCVDNSPEVTILFDEQGRLAEVCKSNFASKSSTVMKSSRHWP